MMFDEQKADIAMLPSNAGQPKSASGHSNAVVVVPLEQTKPASVRKTEKRRNVSRAFLLNFEKGM